LAVAIAEAGVAGGLNVHLFHEDIERIASLEDLVRLLLGNLHNQLSRSLSSTTAESVAVSKVI
jgi:hypothetical protein